MRSFLLTGRIKFADIIIFICVLLWALFPGVATDERGKARVANQISDFKLESSQDESHAAADIRMGQEPGSSDHRVSRNLYNGEPKQQLVNSTYSAKVKIFLQFLPSSRRKLLDQSEIWGISLTGKEAKKIHSLLKQLRVDFIIYQDRKVFRTLEDSEIHKNLPICILRFGNVKNIDFPDFNRAFESTISEVRYPYDVDANFSAVRLILRDNTSNKIILKFVDCGYLTNSRPNDDYKKLHFADLWATTGFRLIEMVAERE